MTLTSNDSNVTVAQVWTIEFLVGLNMLPLHSCDCNLLRNNFTNTTFYEQLYIFMVPTVLLNGSVSESWFLPCFRVESRPHWTEKEIGNGLWGGGADWLHFVGLRSFEMGGEGPREVWSIPDATELRNMVSTLAANAGIGGSLIRGKSTTFPASL